MSHSFGMTGATYASGTRGMPGGSAFTLTGVFVDRITPRLMAVGAAARAQATQINAMGTKLGRMNAYLDRQNAALAQNRANIKALAMQRVALNRSINANNAALGRGVRLATEEEQAKLRSIRTAIAGNASEMASIDAKIAKLRAAAIMYEIQGRAATKAGLHGRVSTLLTRGAQDDVKLQALGLSRQKLVGTQTALNYKEKEYIALLKIEGVQLDGATHERLKQKAADEALVKGVEKRIALHVVENGQLVTGVQTQNARIRRESVILNILREQIALIGGARAIAMSGLKLGAGLGIGAGVVSGIAPIVAAGTMMEYEQSLARIGAIGQFTSQERAGIGKYTTGMSQQYALSPEQMLGGTLVGVKAGYRDVAELQGMLVPSMQLAIVNGEELDKVMEQLIMTMNAFHIEASRANEVVANQQALINNSLLQFGDYTDGMKYAAAWANKLGLSYEEVGSMIATMTDAGVRAGISGRSLRRMYSKFAADMDVIAEKLAKGGSELDVFTEDGVLNIRQLIETLGNGVDNVEDMQFALERFGLRGAQSFLLLAQNLDKYDKLLGIQTGNTAELAEMAEKAQNTISGQWQLLKNMMREPLLTEELMTSMKELVKYMREEGGLKDLADTFANIVRNSMQWLRSGGFKDLVRIIQNIAKIFQQWQPILLTLTDIMAKMGRLWYVILPIARMMKANTLLNALTRSMLIFYAAQRGGMGAYSGRIGGMLGMSGSQMLARPAAAATTNAFGFKIAPAAGAAAGAAGMGGALLVGGALTAAVFGIYLLYKYGQKRQEEAMNELLSKKDGTNVNFYGDTYGIDDINSRILGVSTDAYSYNNRQW